MFKFRIVKLITVFVVALSVLLCNTVYSFAYSPIVKVEDDDWVINSESVYEAVYPEPLYSSYAPLDSVYSISELNGKTYYGSNYGSDVTIDLTWSVDFPPLDITFDETDFAFMFQINNVVWMFHCTTADITLAYAPLYDSSGNFLRYNFVYVLGESATVSLYRCNYPFAKWVFEESRTHSGTQLNVEIVRSWFAYAGDDVLEPLWLSYDGVYLYDQETQSIDYDYFMFGTVGWNHISTICDKPYELDIPTFYYIYSGLCEVSLPYDRVYFLASGDCAIRIDDFGVVVGYETSLCYAAYEMTVYSYPGLEFQKCYTLFDGDVFSDSTDLSSGDISLYDLYPADYKFHDILSFQFFNFPFDDDNTTTEYIVQLRYMFVSDGHCLFFPGTFEIIEFEDYEEEMQHDEIVGAINDAVTSINGQISSSSSALSKEITGAISDMTSDINEKIDVKFDELMYGDTGYDKPDYDTGDLDNLSSQTDSTIDNILSQLDSDVLAQLPGGYTTFDAYFSSSVNTIHTDFSKAFLAVRNVFDRFVSVTDISVLLLFSLIFGFAIFVLGRSLKRD